MFDKILPSWFHDEGIRQKIAALDADGFAAMGFPRTERSKVLNLSKLIAWVSIQAQSTWIVTELSNQYFPWDDCTRLHVYVL